MAISFSSSEKKDIICGAKPAVTSRVEQIKIYGHPRANEPFVQKIDADICVNNVLAYEIHISNILL
jgi:hypothetical protein